MNRTYYLYILTNLNRQVLYIGVTNDLARRLFEHEEDANGAKKSFAGKYNCTYLVYWESYQYVNNAIAREKELKGWKRERKYALIKTINPEIRFLNEDIK